MRKYMVDELNKEHQHKIPLIPARTYDTALYDYSIQDKEDSNMYVSSGYNGYKSLVFSENRRKVAATSRAKN